MLHTRGNRFIFVRHGETKKDPSKPAVEWGLTPEAEEALRALATSDAFSLVKVIYASNEDKAQKSAVPFAQRLGLPVQTKEGLEEVHRGSAYLTDEEFKLAKREKLEHRDSNRDEGETANAALARFCTAMEEIDASHENTEIMIVSHGTILSLFFSFVKNDFSQIFAYWQNMPFCAVGIIENGAVTTDISSA